MCNANVPADPPAYIREAASHHPEHASHKLGAAHLGVADWTVLLDWNMVPRGLEPRTLRLLAVRSNQLSYETLGMKKQWPQAPQH